MQGHRSECHYSDAVTFLFVLFELDVYKGKKDYASDKLTIKDNYLLRIIIYRKKNYHFICKLQKSLYLCSRKQ